MFTEAIPHTLSHELDIEMDSLVRKSTIDKSLYANNKEVSFSDLLSNKMLAMQVINEGIPYSLFEIIAHNAPFNENDWANFLDISTKSLQRYKQTRKTFKPSQSEKIIELAEITSLGLELFGSIDTFKLWLTTPSFALGNHKPTDLLKSSFGKEMVAAELSNINQGIFV